MTSNTSVVVAFYIECHTRDCPDEVAERTVPRKKETAQERRGAAGPDDLANCTSSRASHEAVGITPKL